MTDKKKQTPNPVEELGAALNPRYRVLADTYLATWNKRKAGEAAGYSSGGKNYLKHFKRADVRAYIAARLADEVMTADEVLARLSDRARLSGDEFFVQEPYDVAIYEARPLQEKIDSLHARVGILNAHGPELLKGRIEAAQVEIADLEAQLARDPDATFDYQIGTETRYRTVPSLEAARENGVLQFVEGAEYGPNGLKFKWTDPTKALELLGKHHKLFTEKHEHSGAVDLGVKFIAGLSEDDL